jgi:phage terminase small subunit
MTIKQKLFCEAYLQNGFNATQAAITAGYSKKTAGSTGSEYLEKPKIKSYLNKRIKGLLSEQEKLTLEWLQSVLKITRADIRKVITWNEDNLTLKPSDTIDDATAYAIQEVSETIGAQHSRRAVKLESKTKALELLGKYLAILSDNEPPAADQTEKINREERKRRIAALAKKA